MGRTSLEGEELTNKGRGKDEEGSGEGTGVSHYLCFPSKFSDKLNCSFGTLAIRSRDVNFSH